MTIWLFGLGFVIACVAALRWPVVGVFAYMTVYIVNPEKQWWGEPYQDMGARFSLTISLCLLAGMLLHWNQIRTGMHGPMLHSQEMLVCLFTLVVVLSRAWGVAIDEGVRSLSAISQAPADKMPKVAIFIVMMTHLIVRFKEYRHFLYVLAIAGGLYLGWDAYHASPGRFVKGRLDELGGADFRESSMVAAHLAFVSTILGVLFLMSRKPLQRAFWVVVGGFTVNALIMTQTRAAMLGLAVGAVATPLLAPTGQRLRLSVYLVLGGLAFLAISNDNFWQRAGTLASAAEERDASAASRFELWTAGLQMFRDHPLGVGAGSFYTVVGRYDPRYVGRDCHNTYVRCLAELGLLGGALFVAVIVNAFLTLRRTVRLCAGTAIEQEVRWYCFGLRLAYIVYLVCGVFMGMTYVEEFWWFMCLPVCLERATLHALDSEAAEDAADGWLAEPQPEFS